MNGKKILCWQKLPIPLMLKTLIAALVALEQMSFVSSSLAHLIRVRKIKPRSPKHFLLGFSWGRLVTILSHSPHVCYFVLDVVFSCLLRYDLKLRVSDCPLNINILLFCCLTQNYTARERGSTLKSPIRFLDLTSNLHLSPVRDTWHTSDRQGLINSI